MRLVDLQGYFASAVQRPRPLADDAGAVAQAKTIATGNDRVAPVGQLDIYREQFWLRHVGSLDEDYPTLRHLLGRDRFHDLCVAYLEAHPSRSFLLRDLGDRMADFVSRVAPYADDPLLEDCARTEWAFIEAFDAADAARFDPSILASIDEDAWATVRVVFQPALRRLALRHPAHDFRAAVRRGEDPPRPEPSEARVVVFRDDLVRYIDVEPAPFALVEALAEGTPLGAACERVAELAGGEEALQAALPGWFEMWTRYGWIAELAVPG